jgi:hypothetical protein
MDAYFPESPVVLLLAAALGALLVGIGWFQGRFGNRALAWVVVVAGFLGMEVIVHQSPAGFRMLALISALLYGMKGVVAVESRLAGHRPLSPLRWLVFCCLWFGMRPEFFSHLFLGRRNGAGKLVRSGLIRMALGAGFFLAARWAWGINQVLAVVLVMVGLSLFAHFGLFDLLAGIYRFLGADCTKLFRAPFLSRSLAEFWSRRWNIAFSEMAATTVYRPWKSRLGPGTARTVAFVFSGLVHELAISLPVKGGYGLPFLYFLLHAVAMRLEGTGPVRRLLARPGMARAWSAAWVLLPTPILFHPAFCQGVLVPLLK